MWKLECLKEFETVKSNWWLAWITYKHTSMKFQIMLHKEVTIQIKISVVDFRVEFSYKTKVTRLTVSLYLYNLTSVLVFKNTGWPSVRYITKTQANVRHNFKKNVKISNVLGKGPGKLSLCSVREKIPRKTWTCTILEERPFSLAATPTNN